MKNFELGQEVFINTLDCNGTVVEVMTSSESIIYSVSYQGYYDHTVYGTFEGSELEEVKTFQTEFDKRLRRVCGVEDDSLPVSYEERFIEGGTCGEGTCWYDDTYEIIVTVQDGTPFSFSGMAELIRELNEVEL